MNRYLLYLIALILSQSVAGQDIIVKAEYPRVVTSGEQFSVMYTINSGGGEFSGPTFEGFYKLMGPQTSYSSSTQLVGGRMYQSTSYSYVYYLQALNPGKYSVPPSVFRYKNKEYKSDSLNIEVIKEAATQQGNANAQPNDEKSNTVQGGRSAIFLRLNLSRNEVYMGEHIIATIKMYTRVDIAGLNEIKFPSFNGFLRENLETPPLSSLQRENINGEIYGTGVVQQFLLYPQVTGEITINPVEITALLQQKSGQTDPFFGEFFQSYQTVPRVIASLPVKVNVKPLPGTKPADFSGIVGNISISAAVNKDTVNVNDAVNYKVTIKGNGNLKLAATPVMKLSPDIEVYDPKVTDNITNNAAGSAGQKTFEFLLIPRHYGEFTIPPLTYTYFNSVKKQYEKLTTKEFTFYARKGTDPGAPVTVYGGVSKEDVKYVGKDIRFIKASPDNLNKSEQVFISKRSFETLYGFGLLIFLGVLFFRREQVRRNSDISHVRNRKAARVAGKRLKLASDFMNSGRRDEFFEEILKALWGYLSDKLNIPVSELTKTNATESLATRGIDPETIKNLSDVIDKCEFARFSPASSESEISEIFEGTMKFIKTVENSLS
jgi:hypothetical protein